MNKTTFKHKEFLLKVNTQKMNRMLKKYWYIPFLKNFIRKDIWFVREERIRSAVEDAKRGAMCINPACNKH